MLTTSHARWSMVALVAVFIITRNTEAQNSCSNVCLKALVATAYNRSGTNVEDKSEKHFRHSFFLNILSFSGQLTAGELARATGLTTASITGVVDRLEEAGFVHRERDAADRRRVVVHLDTARALGAIAPVFGPMLGAWQRMTDQYTDDQLRLIVAFYDGVEDVIRDHLARLRAQDLQLGQVNRGHRP